MNVQVDLRLCCSDFAKTGFSRDINFVYPFAVHVLMTIQYLFGF